MSWRVTMPCTRKQGEAIGANDDLFSFSDDSPVLVADEPDEGRPNEWLIHAYFEREPEPADLERLAKLGNGLVKVEKLGESDWVRMSQAGLEPISAGRFHVHTPSHLPFDGATNFEIDAGLAFGTGQHATTAGCLAMLDQMESRGERFTNIADIGTGTGLLAFAALKLWPGAKCIATDIDPVAVEVARDNATINKVPLGHGPGELLLVVADGMDSAMLVARAPYELIIANILAASLIELAPTFSKAVLRAGSVVLAGLLDSQAEAVIASCQTYGFELAEQSDGEWPVLLFRAVA